MLRPLSKRTIAIYHFITSFTKEHTYPPTQREIAKAFDISQTTAHYQVNKLRDRGYLTYPDKSSRAIEFTNKKIPSITSELG